MPTIDCSNDVILRGFWSIIHNGILLYVHLHALINAISARRQLPQRGITYLTIVANLAFELLRPSDRRCVCEVREMDGNVTLAFQMRTSDG